MLAERSPAVKKAVVELKRLSQSEEAQRLYEARQKAIRDENSRTRTAHNKGRMEEKHDIALEMLNDGVDINKIVKYTNLPISEIEKLRTN